MINLVQRGVHIIIHIPIRGSRRVEAPSRTCLTGLVFVKKQQKHTSQKTVLLTFYWDSHESSYLFPKKLFVWLSLLIN